MSGIRSVDQARKWFKSLATRIIKLHPSREAREPDLYVPLRDLTKQEWETIKRLVKRFEFPCQLTHTPYGFHLLINDVGTVDTPGIQTPVLLTISDSQFPFASAKRGFDGQEETLRLIAELTHRPRNTELLKFYGFGMLLPVERYSY